MKVDKEKEWRDQVIRVAKIVKSVMGVSQDKAFRIARNAVVR